MPMKMSPYSKLEFLLTSVAIIFLIMPTNRAIAANLSMESGICSVFRNPKLFLGKTVRVKAILRVDHNGGVLHSPRCPEYKFILESNPALVNNREYINFGASFDRSLFVRGYAIERIDIVGILYNVDDISRDINIRFAIMPIEILSYSVSNPR